MRVALFVDGANYSFMQKALGWQIDAEKLLDYCRQFGELVDAFYYTGDPATEQQQGFLTALTYMGYSLVTKPVKIIRDDNSDQVITKANLDIEIALDMVGLIDNYDMAVLVSGDGDFKRVLELLRIRGKRFHVMATQGMAAREIRTVCGMHYTDFADVRSQLERLK